MPVYTSDLNLAGENIIETNITTLNKSIKTSKTSVWYLIRFVFKAIFKKIIKKHKMGRIAPKKISFSL
jgi:hypothetical protein